MADRGITINTFDIQASCSSGTHGHYTAERTDDPPLYYFVEHGPASGTMEKKLYCWKFCPYSLDWREHHNESDGYYEVTSGGITTGRTRTAYRVPNSMQTWHNGTKGRMAYHQRGPRAGFICVDPDCYYYVTVSSGTGYFFQT